ncbi:MAG: serine aminopeptidase domain-containing protein [Christensenellaceae bacterium]
MNRYDWQAKDGKKISVVEWEAEEPKGIVQISHGMAEHVMRYDRFAKMLTKAGYLVFGDDHRCFGYTDQEHLGYTDGNNWTGSISDIVALGELYHAKYSLPLFLMGHSYGSFLTQGVLEGHSSAYTGVILMGSSRLSRAATSFGAAVAGMGCALKGKDKPGKLICNLTFGSYDRMVGGGGFISSLAEEAERYAQDPLCDCVCSNAFYRHFFEGASKLYRKKNLEKLDPTLPLLLIAGEDDPVGDMGKGMKRLYKLYEERGFADLSLTLYPECRHEILNDSCRAQADERILSWLEAHTK